MIATRQRYLFQQVLLVQFLLKTGGKKAEKILSIGKMEVFLLAIFL